MPKNNIDYSNTIIYKIYCNDETVKDVYVGHTTNFIKRKYCHKTACSNLKNTVKIYKVIRENGGWDNWSMIEIARYNCKDATEARIKEYEHYISLNATLNSCPPFVDKNIDKLPNHIDNDTFNNINININSDNNKSTVFDGNSIEYLKVADKYICELCDYTTFKKYNIEKHLTTEKHKNMANGNLEMAKVAINQDESGYICKNCKNNFKTNSGLWKHSKKCNKLKAEMILNVVKDNKTFQDFLIEQNKQLIEQLSQQNKQLLEHNKHLIEISHSNTIGTMNNTINNTNNTNNNKFNISVFLNETCKDAINLTDFVNQITLSLEDLEETSKVGYVEGISNVFIRNLTDIDYKQRPIHCNDYKREVLYIKDDNQWVKDDKEKLTNAIKVVANKNLKQIPNWQKANPEYNNPKSKQNDKYMKMLCEVMSGSSKEEQQKNYNKIIKNISKEVVIDKDKFTS
jgi:hypothetical protein